MLTAIERQATRNHQFHLALYGIARNAPLAELLNRLHYLVEQFKQSTLSVPERAEVIASDHKDKAMRVRLAMYRRHA